MLRNNYLLRMSSARKSELILETRIGDYLSPSSLAELSVDVFRLTHKAELTSGPAGLGYQDKTVGVILVWLFSTWGILHNRLYSGNIVQSSISISHVHDVPKFSAILEDL